MGNTIACVNDRGHTSSSKCVHWNEYINKPVPSGETLLTIAAAEGNAELAKRLIGQGAHVNQPNVGGSTPLQVAIRARNEEVVDVLLDSAVDVNARDRSGLTALHLACGTRSESIVRKLLKCGSNPEGIMDGKFYVSTPLMAATENDDQALAVILLNHRADVNKRDWWQNTALLKAVQVGSVPLVELLLLHGADPNVENRFGGSALHYATIADHCAVTRMLVEGGCRVNAGFHSRSDTGGRSGLGPAKETIVKHSPLAASIHRECYECFRFFLDRGADVNGEDTRRKTPLVYAVTNRAWDCNDRHCRPVPQCFHSDNPTSIDSNRFRFAVELIDRGAKLRPVWEYVIWQMRALYVSQSDRDAILLCIRAMGFVHREDFKVETLYRTLALSMQWEALWTLYLAGFNLTEECRAIALNKVHSIASAETDDIRMRRRMLERSGGVARNFSPEIWMPLFAHRPRSLKNLCIIRIRERLPDNVIFSARRLSLPNLLYRMVTLDEDPV